MLVNENILEMHTEDTGALWLRRNLAVRSNHYNFQQLCQLDNRIDAHVRGLQLGDKFAWQLCKRELAAFSEPGELFAAAVVAFHSPVAERLQIVVDAAKQCGGQALIAAVGWYPFDTIEPLLRRWVSSPTAFEKYLGVAGYAVHRKDPGALLITLLQHRDEQVAVRSALAAAELGRLDLVPSCRALLRRKEIRTAAALALAELGENEEGVRCHLTESAITSRRPRRLIGALVEVDPATASAEIDRLVAEGQHRLAVIGMEALGDVRFVPALLRYIQEDRFARVAGDALRSMFGVDIEYHDLDQAPPDGYDGGVNDEPDDPRVLLDEDDDLPWPSRFKLSDWWRSQNGRFAPGTRYLDGQAIGWSSGAMPESKHIQALLSVLIGGRPCQRLLAARVLSRCLPTLASVEPRAFTGRAHMTPGLFACRKALTTLAVPVGSALAK